MQTEGIIMTFSENLKEYIKTLDITYTQLAKASGLSVSAISHYVKGQRKPHYNGEQIEKIIHGLLSLSKEKDIHITEEELRLSLQKSITNGLNVEYSTYLENLNRLLKALNVKSNLLAKSLSYDPSHISKILSGKRHPGNLPGFTLQVSTYIAGHYLKAPEISTIARLIGCDEKAISNVRIMRDAIITWLSSNPYNRDNDPIAHFLEKMDTFNLDDFIQSIHFDSIKLPSVPFQLPTTKTYTGIKEMMESELDFIKATVLSKSMSDCILYSDMPLEEMAKDPDFPKKWMFGRAMMLKKGLHLNIIHDVNRPFNEMMLGLEGHIPMYMTGQISPYYLASSQNDVFTHLLNVSGAAALEGYAIAGHQSSGRYILFKSKEDINHYRIRAEQLLQKAMPLMDIYRSDRKQDFAAHMRKLWKSGDRQIVHCSLPIYTISEDLLDAILAQNNVPITNMQQIRNYRGEYLTAMQHLLTNHDVTLVVPELTQEQFKKMPLYLALSELFYEADIPYSYETYLAHLEQTKSFARQYANLTLELDAMPTFRNISYSIINESQVIVSKNKYPTIHFVIHHPKMVLAFQNFIPPLRDDIHD